MVRVHVLWYSIIQSFAERLEDVAGGAGDEEDAGVAPTDG